MSAWLTRRQRQPGPSAGRPSHITAILAEAVTARSPSEQTMPASKPPRKSPHDKAPTSPAATLLTPGRALLALGNLAYAAGAFAADYNATHVFNPRWPPHAKFHNGQTMTLGALLAATSCWLVWGAGRDGDAAAAAALSKLGLAAWIGSLYCLAGLSAIYYPGTAWMDPEFETAGGLTQQPIFVAIVVVLWTGYWLERRRLGS